MLAEKGEMSFPFSFSFLYFVDDFGDGQRKNSLKRK